MSFYQCEKCGHVPLPPNNCCQCDGNNCMVMKDETKQQRDDLLAALEKIRDLETKACSRCEGNGRLWADGKPHLPSAQIDTIPCGNCGGSGRILPEDAQEIATQAITQAEEEQK